MSEIGAVLLAGGQARRMGGGDKCLRPLAGRPLLAHVIERVQSQAAPIVLNANGDPTRFADFGLPVATDVIEGFAGPLAGILTGMLWLREHAPDVPWLLSIATDTPFFPTNLAARLQASAQSENRLLACASTHGRTHPVFGLWSVSLADDLAQAVQQEGVRKIDAWTARIGITEVDFPTDPIDPFFNANRTEDLAEAEILYQQIG